MFRYRNWIIKCKITLHSLSITKTSVCLSIYLSISCLSISCTGCLDDFYGAFSPFVWSLTDVVTLSCCCMEKRCVKILQHFWATKQIKVCVLCLFYNFQYLKLEFPSHKHMHTSVVMCCFYRSVFCRGLLWLLWFLSHRKLLAVNHAAVWSSLLVLMLCSFQNLSPLSFSVV